MMADVFLSFLEISVYVGFVVAALVFFTPFINKRYSAKWKYFIWIFLALRLIVPFGWTDLVSMPKEGQSKSVEIADEKTAPSRRITVEIPSQMAAPIAVQSGKNKLGVTALDLIAIVWIFGLLMFLFVHFVNYIQFKRQIMGMGRRIEDASVLSQLSAQKRELHLQRALLAIECEKIKSPMIIGFRKPVLVLPKERYSQPELYFILKHELVHWKRGDVYFKLLFLIANALHWYNPFIWIMRKEAILDIELSCDERVTKGAGYAVQKAYAEALLSTLFKQCAKEAVLSTQFYGGKELMKRRFQNILSKNRKKNGICILLCAVLLTAGMGMLVGCSVAKVEGEQEKKETALTQGDGCSIYLPVEEWEKSGFGMWTAKENEQVRLWVTRFEDKTIGAVGQELADEGYVKLNGDKWKRDGEMIHHVRLKESENDVWGVFYCFPKDAQEGWEKELPVIADTFTVSKDVLNEKTNPSNDVGSYLVKECKRIKKLVNQFATAYFNGDIEAVRSFLASSYAGDVELYESPGAISDLTIKGLTNVDEKAVKDGKCSVSLEFRDSVYEDMYFYLTFELVKEKEGWKVQAYGVEA